MYMPQLPGVQHSPGGAPSFYKAAPETQEKIGVLQIIGHGPFSALHELIDHGIRVLYTGNSGIVGTTRGLEKPLDQKRHGRGDAVSVHGNKGFRVSLPP